MLTGILFTSCGYTIETVNNLTFMIFFLPLFTIKGKEKDVDQSQIIRQTSSSGRGYAYKE